MCLVSVAPAVSTPAEEFTPVWTPDGNGLVYLVPPDSIYQVRRISRNPDKWGKARLFVRAFLVAFSNDGKHLLAGSAPQGICATCEEGLYVMNADGTGRRRLPPYKNLLDVISSAGTPVFSADSRNIFIPMREKDGTSSIWQVPLNDGPAVRLVHFTDPSRQFYRTALDVDSRNFYFPLGDRQSDIWTMELKKQ